MDILAFEYPRKNDMDMDMDMDGIFLIHGKPVILTFSIDPRCEISQICI